MVGAQQQTAETEAVLAVANQAPGAPTTAIYPPGSTPPTLVNTVGFSYSSDVMQLGDCCSVTIPNPRGAYTGQFLPGQCVKLFLRNPNVLGNTLTLKHLGIIVDRDQSTTSRGSAIQITCADLGWHLANNTAPLWANLQENDDGTPVTLKDLLTDPAWIDPSWGIRGISPDTDNETQRLLRQSLNQGRAQAALDLQAALGTLVHVQVEPGDKIADIIGYYCRHINRLFGVTCDGYLQVWSPNYNREPLFRIELHDVDDPARNRNGVLDVHIRESISTIYTNVSCIGEIVGGELALDPANQNATKRRRDFINPWALPFKHRTAFCDADIFDYPEAAAQALWAYNRGVFDSWQAVYIVRGHWQRSAAGRRAYWWESDQMCAVDDTVNGLSGNFYISSVRCDRDEQGDRTVVTLRKPCLQASFGQYKRPPRIVGSIVDTQGATTNTGIATTVTAR